VGESGGDFQLPPVAGSQEYPLQDAVPPFAGDTDDAGDDSQASLLPLENRSPPTTTRRITTGPNDSFWTISEAVYGSKAYYRALFRHNRQAVLRPDQLKAGIELEVPPLETLRSLYPEEFPVDSRGG
jgi:nucleoid-associated protein YgaU